MVVDSKARFLLSLNARQSDLSRDFKHEVSL